MFCASLRRRPSFAPVCSHLTLTASGGLQESQLTTHDIAVPSGLNAHPRTNTTLSHRQLRILLFAPSAVSENKVETTIERIKALFNQPDAEHNHIAIIFLLAAPRNTSFVSAPAARNNDNDASEGVQAYMRLQVELKNHKEIPPLPILPLARLGGLPALIRKHAMATSKQGSTAAPPGTNAFDLLTNCSAQPPMREQTAYVCTDIFRDLRDMAQSCVSVSSAPQSSSPSARAAASMSSQCPGEDFDVMRAQASRDGSGPGGARKKLKMLRDMVGDQERQNVVDFWREEFAVE